MHIPCQQALPVLLPRQGGSLAQALTPKTDLPAWPARPVPLELPAPARSGLLPAPGLGTYGALLLEDPSRACSALVYNSEPILRLSHVDS